MRTTQQRIQKIIAENEFFESITLLLNELLGAQWSGLNADLLELMQKEIKEDQSLRSMLEELQEQMRLVLGDEFEARVSDVVREGVGLAYDEGKTEIAPSIPGNSGARAVDRQTIAWLHRHHMFWIGTHYERNLQESMVRLGEVALRDGLSRRDAGQLFKNRIDSDAHRSQTYWEGLANHIVTRSRNFSNLSRLAELGIDEYEIDAVIDQRTSPQCNFMDKKRFKVSDGLALREKLLQASSPEEVKQIAPWLPHQQVVKMSDAQLVAAGYILPPFHYHCRTRIVMAL